MDFYVLSGGERQGPFRIFQLKEKLETGLLTPDALGWHNGMEAWLPLSEMSALTGLFPKVPDPALPPPLPEMDEDGPLDLEANPRRLTQLTKGQLFWRQAVPRFFARLFDTWVATLLVYATGIATGWIEPIRLSLPTLWLLPLPSFLWIFAEAFLLSRFGTTPGKALLGIHVSSEDGGPPSYSAALTRSLVIWLRGWGLGIDLLWHLSLALSLFFFLQTGITWWDASRRTVVTHSPVRPELIMLFILGAIGFSVVRTIPVFLYPLPPDLPASQRDMWEPQIKQIQEEWNRLRSPAPAPAPAPKPAA